MTSNSKPSGSFCSGLHNPHIINPRQLPLIVTALVLPKVYCQFNYVTKKTHTMQVHNKGCKSLREKIKPEGNVPVLILKFNTVFRECTQQVMTDRS